jgi:hypothetical protein
MMVVMMFAVATRAERPLPPERSERRGGLGWGAPHAQLSVLRPPPPAPPRHAQLRGARGEGR